MANKIEFTIFGIDKITKTLSKISSSISKMVKSILNVAKKAAIATVALLAFVSVTASGIDATAKFSTRIGIEVEELSKLQFVAKQAGVETNQFNLATQRMTRRVAEAAQGLGEAQGALRELGIDAKAFKDLGIEDQYVILSDKINNAASESDKLRLAFKLFDSEGTSVLQMLKGGSASMRALAADAKFLGLAISKQAAANAEHFADSMGRATGSMKGASRAITAELMPVLSGLANRFANSLASSRASIVDFVKDSVVGFFTFIEVIQQVFSRVHAIFTDRSAFSAFLDSIGGFIKVSGLMFLQWAKMIPIVIWEAVKAGATILNKLFAIAVGGMPVEDFTDAITNTVADAFEKATKNISTMTKGPLDEFKNGAVEVAGIMGEAFGINLEAANAKAEETLIGLMEFGQVAKDTIAATGESANEFLTQFQLGYATWLEQMKSNSQEFASSFFSLMTSIIDQISNRMADAIVEGKSMSDAFRGFMKQITKQIVAMLIKMGIQRLITGAANKTITTSEAGTEFAKMSAATYGNAFASTAAIPIVGPGLAPGVAAASLSAMQAGAVAASTSGAAMSGVVAQAHDGLTRTKRAGTVYLDRGERVVNERQNKDLMEFMKNGQSSGVLIDGMEININLPEDFDTIGALRDMDSNDWQDIVAGPLYDAMDVLFRKGVKPSGLGA